MGYNTVFVLSNDNTADIANDPATFVDFVLEHLRAGGEEKKRPVPGVIAAHRPVHADSLQLIVAGGNTSTVIGQSSSRGYAERVQELREMADALGFDVVERWV